MQIHYMSSLIQCNGILQWYNAVASGLLPKHFQKVMLCPKFRIFSTFTKNLKKAKLQVKSLNKTINT